MTSVRSFSTLSELYVEFPNADIDSYSFNSTFRLGSMITTAPFVAYAAMFIIGTVGNVGVAAVIGRLVAHWIRGGGGMDGATGSSPTGSRGMHIYILALCCFDLLVLACVPMVLMDLALGQWTIPSSLVCKLVLSGDCLAKFGAPLLLTALSGFCYLSICRGSRCTVLRSRCDLGSSRTALWVVGFCVAVVFVLGTPMWYYGGINYLVLSKNGSIRLIMQKCTSQAMPERVKDTFMAYSFALGYVVPAASFTYFYSAVLYHVHRHAKRMRGNRRARYFWTVAKTSMCLVIFYLLCWTPYWCVFLVIHVSEVQTSGTAGIIFSYFIHMLPYINCCGYPILYTMLNRNIKDDYGRMARRSREKREHSRQVQKSGTWAGKSQQLQAPSYRETSCGYWSNNNTRTDSPDRSLETMIRAKSPTAPLCSIEDCAELAQFTSEGEKT